jgi:hypothetical protein
MYYIIILLALAMQKVLIIIFFANFKKTWEKKVDKPCQFWYYLVRHILSNTVI